MNRYTILLLLVFAIALCSTERVAAYEQFSNDAPLLININLPFAISDHQIFQNPWQSYQRLMEYQDAIAGWQTIEKAWWLLRKAQCENLLYNYRDFDKTLAELEQLIDVEKPSELTARLAYFRGLSVHRAGSYQQSRQLFSQSMAFAQQFDLNHIYIKSKQELAYTYSLSERYETSLKDLQQAFIAAFAMNDELLLALINETYGAIYGYMQDEERSLEYYQKALETYQRLGYPAHIAEATYGMASTYRYAKEFDKAIALFMKYQQQVSYSPNKNMTYFGAYGLGMSLAEKGDCQQALEVIEHALSLEGIGDYDAELYKRQASCLLTFGQLDQAEKAIIAAEQIFAVMPELDNTAWSIETTKVRAQLAFKRGQYQLAYELLDDFYSAYTDVIMNNSSDRMENLRASLELERQEVEQALSDQRHKALQLEREKQEHKALQQSYFIIFLVTALLAVMILVTYQYRNNRKMAAISITDPLSGVYNRRYTFDYLEKTLNTTAPSKGDVCVLVLDVDDFKRINDQHGHPAGDKVIAEVAQIVTQSLRPGDLIGRIGGEEFMCILPRTSRHQGEAIADRMRENVASLAISLEHAPMLAITISVGLSTMTISGIDALQLYADADKALYQAKRQGKNCVVVHQAD